MEANQHSAPDNCAIACLPDSILLNMFQRLHPNERLFVSEVCTRWYDLSRLPWTDINHLDLCSIPGLHSGAILSHCPSLTSIIAKNQTLFLRDLKHVSFAALQSIKLYHCNLAIWRNSEIIARFAFPWLFAKNLDDKIVLKECVLHEIFVCVETNSDIFYPLDLEFLPRSLKRLQLSGLNKSERACTQKTFSCFNSLAELESLECLMLHSENTIHVSNRGAQLNGTAALASMRSLKELYIGKCEVYHGFDEPVDVLAAVAGLPNLEVLFVDADYLYVDTFIQLVTRHRKLRILLIQGTLTRNQDWRSSIQFPSTVPIRRRYSSDDDTVELAFLNIFLGKTAAKNVRFEQSRLNYAKVYVISQALPEFLQSEEANPFFANVWLAERMLETAKQIATAFR